MWPTSFALKELTAADEKKIAVLVKKAGELKGGARQWRYPRSRSRRDRCSVAICDNR